MIKPIISVIIPIYNVEKYICDSIESIINQSIGVDKIEIILINDGSTDNSISVIKEYINNYKNIKLINLKKSSGSAGKPRNIGIKEARGKYCIFVDSDDICCLDAFEELYYTAEEFDSDIVCGKFLVFNEDGENDVFKDLDIKQTKNTNVIDTPFLLQIPNNLASKLYKTEFIKSNNITFPEGVASQDAYFVTKAFLISDKITFIDKEVFKYRIRPLSDPSITQNRNIKYFNDFSIIRRKLIELYENYENIDYFNIRFNNDLKWLLYQLEYCNEEDVKAKIKVLETIEWFIQLINRCNIEKLDIPNIRKKFLEHLINKNYIEAIKYMGTIKHNLFADI